MSNPDRTQVRYVLHPGYVTSRNDGQRHYVGIAQLAKLYGLDIRAPNVAIAYGLRSLDDLPDDVHLYPRYNGDYRLITNPHP